MSKVLKAVILLFILVSIDCKHQSPVLKEIIQMLQGKDLKKLPCRNAMVPHINFMAKGVKASELFCKASKALENVPACLPLDIIGLRSNLISKTDRADNCTVNEDHKIQLLYFLNHLRRFSQSVFLKE